MGGRTKWSGVSFLTLLALLSTQTIRYCVASCKTYSTEIGIQTTLSPCPPLRAMILEITLFLCRDQLDWAPRRRNKGDTLFSTALVGAISYIPCNVDKLYTCANSVE